MSSASAGASSAAAGMSSASAGISSAVTGISSAGTSVVSTGSVPSAKAVSGVTNGMARSKARTIAVIRLSSVDLVCNFIHGHPFFVHNIFRKLLSLILPEANLTASGICHYLIRDTRSFVMSSFPSPYASTVYRAEGSVCFSPSDSAISKS